jgi:hypothetical protein
MTGFAGSLAVMTPENEKLVVALGSLATFGVGGVLVPAATVAMLVCPDALITTAAAMSLSIRTVGGSIGYSIYYNIFATKLEQNLPPYVAEYAIKAGLPLSSATQFVTIFLTNPKELATTKIPGLTPAVIAGATKGTQWAFSESLKYVWVSCIHVLGGEQSELTKNSSHRLRSEALRLFARFCCRARRSIRLIALPCRLARWVVELRFMALAGDCKWMIENRLCKYQNNGMIERFK